MNVLRHDHISHYHELIALPRLFENGEESVTGSCGLQQWQSVVARTSDKVQMVRTVSTMQAAGHNSLCYRQPRTRPCKKRKDGAPAVSKGERKSKSQARATRPPTVSKRERKSKSQARATRPIDYFEIFLYINDSIRPGGGGVPGIHRFPKMELLEPIPNQLSIFAIQLSHKPLRPNPLLSRACSASLF